MERLKSLFADFPYDSFNMLQLEQHYQDVIYILAKLMGFSTHVEYMTANGRIDLVIKTKDYIYVFEFKIDKTPEQRLLLKLTPKTTSSLSKQTVENS